MRDRTFEETTSKSRSLQSTRKGSPLKSQVQNDHPLTQAINRLGNTGSVSTHAAVLQRAPSLARHSLLHLQQQYGNHYVQRVMALARQGESEAEVTPEVEAAIQCQPKLKISASNDKYEQEADRLAAQVIRMPEPVLQRQMDKEEEEEILRQTKPMGQGRTSGDMWTQAESPPIVHEVLRSPGQPLDTTTRAFMEPRFGHDFSQVRVHRGAQASETARSLKAKAFTVGRDVAFGPGQYSPSTTEGKRLLAHELTHTLQQRTLRPRLQKQDSDKTDKKQPWEDLLKKGREGLTLEISNNLDLIRTKKSKIAETWKANVKIVEEKPAAFILKLALGIASAGLAGVMGGIVGKVVNKVITQSRRQDFVIGAATKTIGESLDGVSKLLINIVTAREPDKLKANAQYGLDNSTKSGLVDYYIAAFDNMLLVENKASHSAFTDKLTTLSDTELAIMLHTSDKVFDELNKDNRPIMQQLTIGYLKLLDEIFIESKAEEFSGKTREERRKNLFGQDPTINETKERSGSMLIVGPIRSIGTWRNPNFSIRAGIVTGLNKETFETLEGEAIKNLPFTLSFRFWGSMVKRGFFGGGSMVKIWFVKRPDGTIAVDLDESWERDSKHLDQGREWLALFGMYGPFIPAEPLAEELILSNVAEGALKVYNQIKDMKIPKVINLDVL